MSAPLDLVFGDDFGSEPVVPMPSPSCGGLLAMIPMPETMYPDVVAIRKKSNVASGGRLKHSYGAAGDPIAARVDSMRVDRPDTAGRVTVRTLHVVATPTDPHLVAEDMLVWEDCYGTSRNLMAEGPSIPQGLGDIEYTTDTFEII